MKKFFISKKFLFPVIFLILGVFSLEALSRNRKCENNCGVTHCLGLPSFSSPEVSSQNRSLWTDLSKRINAGEKISKKEYREAADKLIIEISPDMLGNCYNGLSCKGFGRGYVRNDLPAEAEKFVKRHELEHLLQTGHEKNAEFSANLAAGKEYPIGLLQTVFFSLKNRFKYQESWLCYVLTIWGTFRIYFFPFN
jgi:hypothetical protein